MKSKSKKGRLAGGVRKEISERRSEEAIDRLLSPPKATDKPLDIRIGRVTKNLGANHVRVAIESKHGAKELIARIPNYLTKRGSTPVTTRSVVIVYTGPEYDPEEASRPGERAPQFDIVSLLTTRQISEISKVNAVPAWMLASEEDVAARSTGGKAEEAGFIWEDRETAEEEGGEETRGRSRGGGGGAAAAAVDDDDFDIDDI
jgi:hypothetical protein